MGNEDADVVTLGETLACFTSQGRLPTTQILRKSIGGTESNTATGLARLGHRVAWVSRLGEDPLGDEILRTLRGEGIDVTAVTRSDRAPTGLMIKEARSPEDIHVYYYRHGSAAAGLSEADVPEDLVAGAGHVHLTGITLALGDGPAAALRKTLSIAKANEVPVSFDPNLRRKLWGDGEAVAAYEEIFPDVDDLLISRHEASVCAGTADLDEAIDYLAGFGIPRVALRRGARGVLGIADGERHEMAAHPVGSVVDTVGAGDAFNAGYLHGRISGRSFPEALDCGNWVASRVIAHAGDYEGLPSRQEYDDHRDDDERAPR